MTGLAVIPSLKDSVWKCPRWNICCGYKGELSVKTSMNLKVVAVCASVMGLALTGLIPAGLASGASNSAQVAAAKKAVLADEALPETLPGPGRTKLPTPPPRGKHIVYLECNLSACVSHYQEYQQAVKLLHWTVSVVPFTATNPASLISAMDLAVSQKPDGIDVSGYAPSAVAAPLALAKAAGIPVVFDSTTGVTPTGMGAKGNGIVGFVNGGSSQVAAAQELANYMIAESDGQADIGIFSLADFPILTAQVTGARTFLQTHCSDCNYKQVYNEEVTGIGTTIPGAIVSVLEADPSMNYVYMTCGCMDSDVAAAIKAAGFSSRVAIVVGSPEDPDYPAVRNGTIAAAAGTGYQNTAYDVLDAFARYFEKVPLDKQPIEVGQLFTHSSPPIGDGTQRNLAGLYKALWDLGG